MNDPIRHRAFLSCVVAGGLAVAGAWVVEMASPSASAAEETAAIKTAQDSDGRWATLQALPPPPPKAPGFPDRSPDLDVLPEFAKPPEGYGPVPIYLWNGDKLTRERLAWQLDQLKDSGLAGVCVFYGHSHRGIDLELNRNYKGPFGRTEPGDPLVFSDEWWKIWDWFSAECAKRKLAVGFLDYTFNPLNSGYWPDEIACSCSLRTTGEICRHASWQIAGQASGLNVGLHPTIRCRSQPTR